MANITFRESSTPTIPGAMFVKHAPLTNAEVDANFKALNDDIQTRVTVTVLETSIGNVSIQSVNDSISMAIALG